MQLNAVPAVVGGVAIAATELTVLAAGAGVAACSATKVCSDAVEEGLKSTQKVARDATNAIIDYTVGIFSSDDKKSKNKANNAPPQTTQVASTPPPEPPPEDNGVKLTRSGKQSLGNLTNLKDKTVQEAIRLRGGTGSNVNQVASHLRNKKVGEIANRAAQGDAEARTALKIIKEAKRLSQKR